MSTKFAHEQLEFDFHLPSRSAAKTERLLTIAEACNLFNLPLHALRRAVRLGSIPSYRVGNGRVRLRGSDIERTISASRTGGPK